MAVFVMTGYEMPDNTPLRLQLDDHWFNLLPNEPLEIESPFYAAKLIEHYGPVYGIIEVPTERTRGGLSMDIDKAEDRARKTLYAAETLMVENWVRVQMEERVKEGKPVMPPVGRVEQIIKSRNIDLRAKYNLSVVGFDFTPAAASTNPELERENAELRQQLADARAASSSTDTKLAKLMAHMGVDDADLEAAAKQ